MRAKSIFETGLELVGNKLRDLGAHHVHLYEEGNRTYLVASNADRSRTVWILTRTRAKGTWQTSIDYGHPCKVKPSETNFWIFVDLQSSFDGEFYVVPESWISNDIYQTHDAYISRHDYKRLKTEDSKHHAIAKERIKQWRDRWDRLKLG